MLTINYFASIREELGTGTESLTLSAQTKTVGDLIDSIISERGEPWMALQDRARVLVAVNQTIVDRTYELQGDEEVAFFPPMTGG